MKHQHTQIHKDTRDTRYIMGKPELEKNLANFLRIDSIYANDTMPIEIVFVRQNQEPKRETLAKISVLQRCAA